MAELIGFGLENFRVFKEMTNFELAPITILTGTNSSGKSSILKALLLLAENAKKNKLSELDYTGPHHNLGNFKQTLNFNNEKDEISFKFIFKNDNPMFQKWEHTFFNLSKKLQLNLKFIKEGLKEIKISDAENENMEYFYLEYHEKGILLVLFLQNILENIRSEKENARKDEEEHLLKNKNLKKKTLNFANLLHPTIKEINIIDSLIINKHLIIDKIKSFKQNINFINEINTRLLNRYSVFNWSFKSIDNYFADHESYNYQDIVDLYFQHEYYYTNNQDKIINRFTQIPLNFNEDLFKKITISDLFENEEDMFTDHLKLCGDIEIDEILSPNFIYFFNKILKPNFLEIIKKYTTLNIDYLEAVKSNAQRIYSNQSQGTVFNSLLLGLLKNDSDKNEKIIFLKKWLREFGIADEIEFESLSGAATRIFLLKKGKRMDLVDFGYGVTQLLPILIKIAGYSNDFVVIRAFTRINSQFLLIEEPETNLHPRLQSKLAEMFIEASKKFEIKFIIETHSEYFIRKLQYLTAKKEVKIKDDNDNEEVIKIEPKDTIIYYLNDPDNIPKGEKQVKKININEDGSLTDDFGEGFFDEADNLALELLRLKKTHKN